jgi:hypothetical protein
MAADATAARIARARTITSIYAHAAGLEREDLATQVCDLITDLLHLTRIHGGDWRAVLAAAIGHHASETIGPCAAPSSADWQAATVSDLAVHLRTTRQDAGSDDGQADVIPLFGTVRRPDLDPAA